MIDRYSNFYEQRSASRERVQQLRSQKEKAAAVPTSAVAAIVGQGIDTQNLNLSRDYSKNDSREDSKVESPKIINNVKPSLNSSVEHDFNNPQMIIGNNAVPKILAKPRAMDEAKLNEMLQHVGVRSKEASPEKRSPGSVEVSMPVSESKLK